MRTAPVALGLLALAACAPTVPDAGNGVGFGQHPKSRVPAVTAPLSAMVQPQGATAGPMSDGAEIAAATAAALSTDTVPARGIGSAATQSPTAVPQSTAPTPMSDGKDFGALATRETVTPDRARLAQSRATSQQMAPTAVPLRPDASETTVIDFARATTNTVGQAVYKRSGDVSKSQYLRACSKYGDQDAAQEAFLNAGGPNRDPKGLDPDGDGFACFWDPTPFRQARLGVVAPPIAREVLPEPGTSDKARGG